MASFGNIDFIASSSIFSEAKSADVTKSTIESLELICTVSLRSFIFSAL